jgi:hypothetical protein
MLDDVVCDLRGEHRRCAGEEVRDVLRRVEAQQIEIEEGVEDLRAPRHHREHVERRKRDVEEMPHRSGVTALAHRLCEEQQVIVVRPEHGARTDET